MELLDSHQHQLSAMQSAMPNRPLTLKHAEDSVITQILYIIIGLMLTIMGCYLTITGIGEILEDRKIANNPIDVPTAVVKGSCKGGKIPFLRGCDVTISNAGTTVHREFSFLGFGSEDYDVKVVAQKDNPKNMNVDLATDHFINRIFATLAWLLLALLGFGVASHYYQAIPVNQRLKKLFNSPNHQPWELVALPVKDSMGVNLKYNNTVEGKPKEMEFGYNNKDKKPFWLGNEENFVVAIKAKDTQTYIPLLQNLNSIDLKKDEKKALLRAYNNFDRPTNIRQS